MQKIVEAFNKFEAQFSQARGLTIGDTSVLLIALTALKQALSDEIAAIEADKTSKQAK